MLFVRVYGVLKGCSASVSALRKGSPAGMSEVTWFLLLSLIGLAVGLVVCVPLLVYCAFHNPSRPLFLGSLCGAVP